MAESRDQRADDVVELVRRGVGEVVGDQSPHQGLAGEPAAAARRHYGVKERGTRAGAASVWIGVGVCEEARPLVGIGRLRVAIRRERCGRIEGGQPAIYINSYHGNTWLREAADKIFEIAEGRDFRSGRLRRLLPYLNAMHEGYDFAWEREWRLVRNLDFKAKDIVCVVLPEQGEEALTREFLKRGVPVVSPGWSADRIVAEFSRQARRAKALWAVAASARGRGKRRRGDA